MDLLRDEELIANLTLPVPAAPLPDPRYIIGMTLPVAQYGNDSPVQASSVDLHIGDIYLPGAKETAQGAPATKTDHVLKTGETAVVTTLEKVNFPKNVAAFGFPPSRVSFRGLLMTNPGHVDPGYKGQLRFTVINMSKEPYALNQRDPIVTLLLFRWEENRPVHAGWRDRNGVDESQPPRQQTVNRLSKDFVNVEKRAKDIANSQGLKWTAGLTAAVALFSAILTLMGGGLARNKDLQDLQTKQAVLETKEANLEKGGDASQKLQDLEKRINNLERALQTSPGAKGQKGSSNQR